MFVYGKDYIMKLLSKLFLNCSLFALLPVVADAAGTYYTGGYRSPQTRYGQNSYTQRNTNSGYSSQGVSAYARNQYANAGYSNVGRANQYQQNQSKQQKQQPVEKQSKSGFTLGAGFARQSSMWQFEMKNSESILHYDNIDWNVLDVRADYVFGNKTQVQVGAGVQYGMQSGESTMVDDDITNGGYLVAEYYDKSNVLLGQQKGNALSIGTSKDGSMLGFNVGVGLKDFMKWGNLKITPSVGWRYLKYDLETHNNHGMAMDIFDGQGGCFVVPGSDEIQCDPAIFVETTSDGLLLLVRSDTNKDGNVDLNDLVALPAGSVYVDMAGNYYFEQPQISHKYEVEWSGPYLALDMQYDINQNNKVNAFVELGLPSYTATGDQPYRFDWMHPKSVEDSAGVGGAFHLGLGANWSTAISDNVALTLGFTYDYYTVSDADAKTYLNGQYYTDVYNILLQQWIDAGYTETDMLNPTTGEPTAIDIKNLEQECPGWVCNADGEIESFYKSLGIRVGINAKF